MNHPDILVDTFNFLNRNEIEKCQLISNLWDKTISKTINGKLNHKRYIYTLRIESDPIVIFSSFKLL